MPNSPHSPLQDGPAVTDADLEALLAGNRDVAPRLWPVADVLAALSTEPSRGELTGEARALAEFRRRTSVPRRHARRGTAGLRTKAAAGAAAAVVVLGGAATAAFADVLPAPIQRFAHDAIGAPYEPSARQDGRAPGKTAAPGQFASHGQPKASAKPHGKGGRQNRPGPDQQGNGQGQQGNGQGQPGVGSGQQGNDQGTPHATGQYGDPHPQGQPGDPHPLATQAASHARPARHRPAVDT